MEIFELLGFELERYLNYGKDTYFNGDFEFVRILELFEFLNE